MGDSNLRSNVIGSGSESIDNIASITVNNLITIGDSTIKTTSNDLVFNDTNAGAKTLSEIAANSNEFNINTPDLTGTFYNITDDDFTILINDSNASVSGTVNVYLPSPSDKRMLNIVKTGSSYDVHLVGSINDIADLSIQYNSYTVHSTAASWYVV